MSFSHEFGRGQARWFYPGACLRTVLLENGFFPKGLEDHRTLRAAEIIIENPWVNRPTAIEANLKIGVHLSKIRHKLRGTLAVHEGPEKQSVAQSPRPRVTDVLPFLAALCATAINDTIAGPAAVLTDIVIRGHYPLLP